MARFRGTLVLLCAFGLLISESQSSAYNLINWNTYLCVNGTIPVTTSCSTYNTCTNPLMTLLQNFIKWNKSTWSTYFTPSGNTCSLNSGTWEPGFLVTYSSSLNSIVPSVSALAGKRMRKKRATSLASILTPFLTSSALTATSSVSMSCWCNGALCYFDDIYRDCRIWTQLNSNRQKACAPLTTTTDPPPPTSPITTAGGGAGLTAPKTTAATTTVPTTTVPTTTVPTTTTPAPTTVAAGPTTTDLAGMGCPIQGNIACAGCTDYYTCEPTPNGDYAYSDTVTKCPATEAYCVPITGGGYRCLGTSSNPSCVG